MATDPSVTARVLLHAGIGVLQNLQDGGLAASKNPGAATSPTAALSRIDPESLIKTARWHRLDALLGACPPERVDLRVKEVWSHAYVLGCAGAARRQALLCEALAALRHAGIRSMVLKGLAYEATLYPATGLRPCADNDILVPSLQRQEAFLVLEGIGYKQKQSSGHNQGPHFFAGTFVRDGDEMDLHTALATAGRSQVDMDVLWAAANPMTFGDEPTLVLSPLNALLFAALHMARDQWCVPAGALLDFWLLHQSAKAAGFDPAQIQEKATHWRVSAALGACYACLGHWLPVPMNAGFAAPKNQPRWWIAGALGQAPWQRIGGLNPFDRWRLPIKLASLDTSGQAAVVVADILRRKLHG